MNQNGRIIFQPNTRDLFSMYDRIPIHQITTIRNPVKGVWTENKLSETFFSKENISIIQNGIRSGVYKMSREKYLIDNQDSEQLVLIMRGIFIEYSMNISTGIREQIQSLNQKVIQYCVDKVYQEAQGYLKYLRDASTLPTPIDYPSMPNTHTKQLEFKGFF